MSALAMGKFATADLGDGRPNKQMLKLAGYLANKPTASIPGACGDSAEARWAYRFLSPKKLTWEKILGLHMVSTEARTRQHQVALCIQDTTELDFNAQEIGGLRSPCYEAPWGVSVPHLRRHRGARASGRHRYLDVGSVSDSALHFSTEESQAAYILPKKPAPKASPCVRDAICCITGPGAIFRAVRTMANPT